MIGKACVSVSAVCNGATCPGILCQLIRQHKINVFHFIIEDTAASMSTVRISQLTIACYSY